MALSFPSMMGSMYYESNGGSGMHGFCVFLSFRLSVNILLWVLCDYCEMLACVSEIWELLIIESVHWLLTQTNWFLMMILCGKW
jgi:hypothetical protein